MNNSEWKEVRLGDVAILKYGKGLNEKNRIYGNIPVYSSAGVTGWHNLPLIDKQGIIIGRKGTVGSIYYSKTPFYCIDTAYYITEEDTKTNLKYLYYLLKNLNLDKLNTDSAVPGLNRDNAYSQNFNLPSLPEQKRIAEILSSLDDKIELNNQMNKTLEETAQTIFKRWFVDFNFPNESGEPYKSSGGEMVESELGLIPKGWRVGKLGDIALFRNGKSSPERKDNAQISVFGANGEIGKTDKWNTENCIVIGRVGSYCGSLYYCLNKCWVTDNSIIGKLIECDKQAYLYFILQNSKLNSRKTGSGQPLINQDILNSIKIVIPCYDLLRKYEEVVSGIFEKIELSKLEIQSIIYIRDSLLPKLMNGEIRTGNN